MSSQVNANRPVSPFKRSSTMVKRKRPSWWTPEGVLSRLQAGEYIMTICQTACDEMAEIGIQLLAPTLRADVTRWCESASWGEQLRTALSMWKKTPRGEMALSSDWHDDFLHAMEITEGNAEKAAKLAGIGYGLVLARLDRRNKCFDAEFTEKFRVAELERVGRMREKYMTMAEEGEGKLAVRAQERLIETALPGLHSPKQEVHVSGKVEHDHDHKHQHLHQHLHSLSPELARQVVTASQERVRKIVGSRSRDTAAAATGMLTQQGTADGDRNEDRVIDLTPIGRQQREKVSA